MALCTVGCHTLQLEWGQSIKDKESRRNEACRIITGEEAVRIIFLHTLNRIVKYYYSCKCSCKLRSNTLQFAPKNHINGGHSRYKNYFCSSSLWWTHDGHHPRFIRMQSNIVNIKFFTFIRRAEVICSRHIFHFSRPFPSIFSPAVRC